MINKYHTTVLLQETIDALNIKPGKKYIDATLGGGGHSFEIVGRGGIVLGLDADQDAIEYVEKIRDTRPKIKKEDLTLVKANFRDIDEIAREKGFDQVAGIIYDLGVSSHQLDTTERGFSFQGNGTLDMRMDQDLGVKAADLVNILTKGELIELFTRLGEEHFANRIAEGIVQARKKIQIKTTFELSEIVRSCVPSFKSKINPATKVFQALRIAVNDEFNSLKDSLPKAFDLLDSGGRMAVISFHSLEDRIVKYSFKEWNEKNLVRLVVKKPIIPSEYEIENNKRSRSAKLRVIEKI